MLVKCQWWTPAPPLLHATSVSVFVPGRCALLHMFVFHMVRAVHCKSAPPRPPSFILWPCLLVCLWGHPLLVSAWTCLQRGLPLCLRMCCLVLTSLKRLYFQTRERMTLVLNIGLCFCHKVALGWHAVGLLSSVWRSFYLIKTENSKRRLRGCNFISSCIFAFILWFICKTEEISDGNVIVGRHCLLCTNSSLDFILPVSSPVCIYYSHFSFLDNFEATLSDKVLRHGLQTWV